jgi:hypoxanthine phosphoribosyltransferase
MKILIEENKIFERIRELAEEISRDYKSVAAVIVLKGAKMFADKLLPELRERGVEVEEFFVRVSSYGEATESSGKVKIVQDVEGDLMEKDVLIIEDIIDTGLTVEFLNKYFLEKGVKSVKICALTSKSARRRVSTEIHYVGFEVPDKFLIGFGMDYSEKYRELSYIAVFE